MAKILAVDDDAAILRLVRKMLSIKKHEVTTLQSIKDITIEENRLFFFRTTYLSKRYLEELFLLS